MPGFGQETVVGGDEDGINVGDAEIRAKSRSLNYKETSARVCCQLLLGFII